MSSLISSFSCLVRVLRSTNNLWTSAWRRFLASASHLIATWRSISAEDQTIYLWVSCLRLVLPGARTWASLAATSGPPWMRSFSGFFGGCLLARVCSSIGPLVVLYQSVSVSSGPFCLSVSSISPDYSSSSSSSSGASTSSSTTLTSLYSVS